MHKTYYPNIFCRHLYVFFACLLFGALLCGSVQAKSEKAIHNEASAQWHINYGNYLIDIGQYFQALENYETAFELSTYKKTRAKSLFAQSLLLSSYLDASDKAVQIYDEIIADYPQKRQKAFYRKGFLYYELGENKKARETFKKYNQKFPQGRYRYQVEALLQQIPEKPEKKPPKPEILQKQPYMRVRICKRASRVSLESASGKHNICSKLMGCKKSFVLKGNDSSVWNKLRQSSQNKLTFKSQGVIRINTDQEKGKSVRGNIRILPQDGGRMLVINHIPIEKYLLSVVPAENYASWPINTLKAQAVAARTYAYYQKLHRKDLQYDLVDDIGDQMYAGVAEEHERTDRAIKATSGEILLHNKQPILAMYTANSGGYTANAAAVFGGAQKPYLVAHEDPTSLKGKMAKWTRSYTVTEVENALAGVGIHIKGLKAITPVKRGPSGRIIKARLHHSKGEGTIRMRTTLASSRCLKLPEILVKIKRQGNNFIFKGNGWGHGIGLSQWGAAYMGENENYKKILDFYYPQTEHKKYW